VKKKREREAWVVIAEFISTRSPHNRLQ